jgi:hypothetical protein
VEEMRKQADEKQKKRREQQRKKEEEEDRKWQEAEAARKIRFKEYKSERVWFLFATHIPKFHHPIIIEFVTCAVCYPKFASIAI